MSNTRRLRRKPVGERPGEVAVDRAGTYPGPGAHNAYRCDDCRDYTVVIHVDAGVTPMLLACRATEGCMGRSVSLCYPDGPIPGFLLPAMWEWYRPDWQDPVMRDPGMREHVSLGGLALRARNQ